MITVIGNTLSKDVRYPLAHVIAEVRENGKRAVGKRPTQKATAKKKKFIIEAVTIYLNVSCACKTKSQNP